MIAKENKICNDSIINNIQRIHTNTAESKHDDDSAKIHNANELSTDRKQSEYLKLIQASEYNQT